MGRKVVRLTLDHLEELTAPCRSCVFWQLDPVQRERVSGSDGDPENEVDSWVSLVLREWGSCGRVVLVDGVPKGFALYAPEAFLPGARSFATAPVSADAVLLTQVYVAPDARRGGLGRMLVQGMARDLMERGGIKAVEAFGDTRGDPGWDTHRPPQRPRPRQPLRGVGGVPRQRGLQDPPPPRAPPADADGPALGADVARRGGGRPREADRRRPPGPQALDRTTPPRRRLGVRLRPR